MSIKELFKKRDNANKNAKRIRAKLIALQGTNYNPRVRPEFWEQVARDYENEIIAERKESDLQRLAGSGIMTHRY